jgi:[ribosomal protein S5]-alanine N-acetyltransferase
MADSFNKLKSIEIQTKRLLIKDHSIEDLSEYHQLISNEKNMSFIPYLLSHSIDDTKASLLRIIEDAKTRDRKMYYFGIFLKNKTYVGEIGYSVNTIDPTGAKKVNLGYFIIQKFWNKGITTEAVKAVMEFAFKKNNVQKIELGCNAANVASEKVMIKCGFKKEAYKKNHSLVNSTWINRVEYGMTIEEFNARISHT